MWPLAAPLRSSNGNTSCVPALPPLLLSNSSLDVNHDTLQLPQIKASTDTHSDANRPPFFRCNSAELTRSGPSRGGAPANSWESFNRCSRWRALANAGLPGSLTTFHPFSTLLTRVGDENAESRTRSPVSPLPV